MADDFATMMKKGVGFSHLAPSPSAEHSPLETAAVLPADAGGEEDKASFLQNGVSPEVLRKLRKNAPPMKVDLHGMVVEEAHGVLDKFLANALRRGCREVEVVHGRGLHSADGRGVLRGRVRYWLSHCRLVLAFTEPSRNSGSVLVLLRRAAR